MKKAQRFLKSTEGKIFACTLLAHLVVVVLLNTGILTVPANTSDQVTYQVAAMQIAHLIRSGHYSWDAVYGYHWYPLFVGFAYAIFGSSVFIGAGLNSLIAAFSAVILYRLMRIFGVTEKLSFWFSLIALNCYASAVYTSSLLLKESWVVLLTLLIVYLGYKISRKAETAGFSYGIFLLCLFLFIMLRSIRHFVGFAAAFGLLGFWFSAKGIPALKKWGWGILMAIAFLAASVALTGAGIGKSIPFSDYFRPSFILQTRTQYFVGGTTNTNVAVVVSNGDGGFKFSAKGVLIGLANVAVGPFPWQLPLHKYLFSAIDFIFWYPFLLLGLIGLFSVSPRLSLPILIAGGIVILGVAIGADNIGAYLRYRIPGFILLSVFAPLGYERLLSSIRDKKARIA